MASKFDHSHHKNKLKDIDIDIDDIDIEIIEKYNIDQRLITGIKKEKPKQIRKHREGASYIAHGKETRKIIDAVGFNAVKNSMLKQTDHNKNKKTK